MITSMPLLFTVSLGLSHIIMTEWSISGHRLTQSPPSFLIVPPSWGFWPTVHDRILKGQLYAYGRNKVLYNCLPRSRALGQLAAKFSLGPY